MNGRKEIIEYRTSNTKHFLKSDGTVDVEIYKDPVHYLDKGEYKEIDNSLVKTTKGFKNKSNNFKIEFDEKSDNSLINISCKNKKVSMYPKNMKQKISNRTIAKRNKNKIPLNDITYENMYEDIDINYKIISNQLKESIILNKVPKENKFVFVINTDLDLILNDDNTISFMDGNNECYKIEKPYMTDSKHAYSELVKYELHKNNDSYELTINVDKEWLHDKERVYPVVIDPTVTDEQSSSSVIDTYIFDGDANITTYNLPYLYVGADKSGTTYRTLLKFDLPRIPAGFKVVNAFVRLSCLSDEFGLAYQQNVPLVAVHALTQDWTESEAKWDNMNNKYSDHIEDYYWAIRMDSFHQEPGFEYANNANITNLVQKWYNGEPNFGIMLKEYKEEIKEKSRPAFYAAKDYDATSSAKPLLTITYKNFNGLESYLSYTSQKHDFGEAYINNYTGNLTSTFNVANTIGGALPANLSLVYNTTDVELNEDYGFGLGIKPNLIQTLNKETSKNKEVLKYVDGDGTIHYFYRKVLDYSYDDIIYSDDYYDEDGLGLSITLENDIYIMKDKGFNESKFIKHTGSNNDVYYLEEIKDANDKKIKIIYDNNKLIKVIDGNDQEINVLYETNKITFISPHLNTVVLLNNNLITQITSLGVTENISYNKDNLIEKITNSNGLSTKYDYINQISFKVRKVSEISTLGNEGNYLTFSYNLNDTKVVDKKGHVNTYIFNEYGNVVGTTNLDENQDLKNAYGKTYSFGDSSENANKLLTDKSLIKYVNNILQDSSFENSSDLFASSDSSIISSICDDARSSLNALKVVSNNVNSYIYKNVSVEKDEYYTFSLYVKNNVPLEVSLSYDNKKESLLVKEINNEFVRYQVSINYDKNAINDLKIEIRLMEIGQVIIDDVQLEIGEVANYYNLVDNSDFSYGLDGWKIERSTLEDDYVEIVPLSNDEKALKMNMAPLGYVSAVKKINIRGKKGDTFNLSFWYKNYSINPTGGEGLKPGLWATIFFRYPDDTEYGACVPDRYLNIGSDNWQFFSENFVTDDDYEYLELRLNSFGGANNCYFTNISLFKDLEEYSYDYDENGNLVSSTDLSKETSTMKYSQDNQLLQTISPIGNKFTFEYDNKFQNRMVRAISPTGVTNEIIYDKNNNPIKNKINNRKMFDEIDNNKTYYIRAKGTNKYFNVNSDKTLRVRENECSYDKFYIIKNDDDQIKFKHAILNNYYLKQIDNSIKLVYGDYDNIFYLRTNDNSSNSIVTSNVIIDSDDTESYINKAFTINEDYSISINDWEDSNYNQEFFFEQTDNKLFIESSATYTDDGRFINTVTDGLGNVSTYDYNTVNGLLNSVTDPNNSITNYTYNDKLQLINIKKGEEEVTYQYDDKNLLTNIVFGTDNYKFIYDQFNNPLSTKINNNILITNTYEDNNGNLSKVTYGNNDEIHYTYDKLNRLKSVIKENDTYTNYYDNLGRITKLKSNNIDYLYEYDFAKRLSSYKYDNYSTNYDYGKDNIVSKKIEKLSDTLYTYDYEYNKELALTKLTNNHSVFNYNYDILGRLDNQNINGKYVTSYKYITNGNKTSTVIESVNDNGIIYSYTYDKLGNITEIYKDNVLINKYYYDIHSELIKEDDLVSNLTKVYSYDNYGNILSKKIYTYNTTNLVKEDKYEYTNSNWQDLLTKFNNDTITYDEIGNPTSIGNVALNWMNGRELASYSDGTNTITYKYNLDGIRTSKVVNGIKTNYILEGRTIIFEDRNGDVLYYIYNGSELLGFVYENKTYYYHKNMFGDIIGILDSSYNEIVTYEYDSWGALVNITDNSNINLGTINPFRYRSYYYDEESGFYYLNSRYYNPKMGRFINADNVLIANKNIVSSNLYQYVSNNPINYFDNTGYFADALFDFGVKLGNAIRESAPLWGAAGGLSAADGPLPFGDVIGGAIAIGGTALAVWKAYSKDKSETKENSVPKVEADVFHKFKKDKVYFPENPAEFRPNGLTITTRIATKDNGVILKWSLLGDSKHPVFEWHESFKDGEHYHINEIKNKFPGMLKDAPHFRAGDEIPEPYASIFFS